MSSMLRGQRNPLAPIQWFITLILVLFLGRLAWLQIVQHEQFATQSADNYLAPSTLRALRGEILASDGQTVLATSRIAVDLVYRGVRKGGNPRFFEKIANLIGLDPEAGLPTLKRGEEVVLKKNVPEDKIIPLAEWIAGQPAFELVQRTERVYPEHIDGNLMGYTRLADERPEDKEAGYERDDLVGFKGLEAGLDKVLRGQNGLRYLEVDAASRMIGERIQSDAQRGKSVTLTIDMKLQRAAEKAIEEATDDINRLNAKNRIPLVKKARGAIVALNPKTGEVLALATGPHFDPNWFSTTPRPPQVAQALLDTTYKPTWNRATKVFEPGSTFKLVTASTLLESPFGNRIFPCPTHIRWGGRNWWSWNRAAGMGMLDARGAIAKSCNPWYWQSALAYGPDKLAEDVAKRAYEFGFNQPTGIELIGEQTIEVPSPSQYKRNDQVWYTGNALSMSIGQIVRATPLQIARMLATIVNDGNRPDLTLVKAIDGKPVAHKPMTRISGTKWSVLKEGMQMTTTVFQGTAKHVLGPDKFPIRTAGKTGTAQTAQGAHQDHAWYMGYGPVSNPDLVVVAFFENGVEGSGVALPAVKKVMAAHWNVPLDDKGTWIKRGEP